LKNLSVQTVTDFVQKLFFISTKFDIVIVIISHRLVGLGQFGIVVMVLVTNKVRAASSLVNTRIGDLWHVYDSGIYPEHTS